MWISKRKTLLVQIFIILALIALPVLLYTQEYRPHPTSWGGDDGRLNYDAFIGSGVAVYCVGPDKVPADTNEDGGFKVLDSNGEEMLFVPIAVVEEAKKTVQETGQYVTLGQSERLWWGGQPVTLYLLSSMEFQMNAVNEHGKMEDFRWTECRTVPKVTDDGCPPGQDPNGGEGGRCTSYK